MYPYDDERDNATSEAALNRMVEDRLYWQEQDPEYRRYVDASFKSVYGDNAAEQDATGRTVSPASRAVSLPPFRPSVTPEDTALSGPVGDTQPNAWRDVFKVQKGLSNTKHYAFDMAKERSGEHSPALAEAIRNFQHEKKEKEDGILLPGGPTIKRMKESLFGGSTKRDGQPVANSLESIAATLTTALPDSIRGQVPNSPPAVTSSDSFPMKANYAGARLRQTPPSNRSSGPREEAGWFTLPTEKMPDEPNKWGNRR